MDEVFFSFLFFSFLLVVEKTPEGGIGVKI